jgi:hypothetical protein
MQNISQQQKLSQMLLQQGMQQPQGQMVSGHYIPPALTQYLQPLFGAYAGSKGMEAAEQKQLDLAKAIRQVGTEEVQNILETYKKDPNAALQLASTAQTPQAKALAAQLSKSVLLEPTPEERKYKAAIADGSFKGGFNAFMNQMSEKDKADLKIQNARLGLAQQEQAFNLGLPMAGGGYGGGMPQQAPLQTINPGSPILVPGQQVPQQGMPMQGIAQQGMPQGQMPRFGSKAEQDIYVAKQKKLADLQADALNALPGALNTVNSGLEALNGMLGDTTVDAKGNIVYGKTKPHPGFEGAVGVSGIGSGFGAAGFLPATNVTDFKSRFDEIKGKSFLEAVGSLRGTGAISEIEGTKATQAINRMSLSQSEPEFVKAADDLRKIMLKGYTAAQQRAGAAPMNPMAQPTIPGVKLRYNLSTGQWE